MSLWHDDPAPSRATLASLVAVALIAVGSLGRLFSGGTYLVWALTALAVGAAFAFAFGRRSLAGGFAALLAAWALSLPGLFAREQSASGFPTPDSFRAAWRMIGAGLREAGRAVPPLDPDPRYFILVWTALLFLGFLGAAWVVVRRPVGAIVSALGVVAFSGSLGQGPGRTAWAVAAVAATGAFFLAEGRQRIGRWGAGRVSIPPWLGLPTLAAACGAALLAPVIIGDAPLVQLRSAIRPRLVIIKPLSDIQRQLRVDPPIEVMRVTSPRATYWRLTGLDAYDGREWVLEARPRPVANGEIPQAEPATTGEIIEQRYDLTSLLSPWMPAAYAARAIDVPREVELDEGSQTLLLRDESTPGLSYRLSSRLPRIDVNIPADPRRVTDPAEQHFGKIAAGIVAGARTPLESARRLEQHFKGYTYNEDVPGGHSAQRLQQFLEQRAGYCEQFAATMTLMLRGLGIQARVGVGFLPGTPSEGRYVVSTREAHAWVEANLPGVGWVAFDPTPARDDSPGAPPADDEAATPEPPPPAESTSEPAATPEPEPLPQELTEPASSPVPASVVYTLLAVLAVGAIPLTKRVRRSLRTSGGPAEVVAGAFAELADRARELGWSPRPSETHREFVRRAVGARTALAPGGLADLAARAAYGPAGVTREEARSAWQAVRPGVRAMRSRSSWWRRALAPIDPRPLVPDGLVAHLRRRAAELFRTQTPTGRPSSI